MKAEMDVGTDAEEEVRPEERGESQVNQSAWRRNGTSSPATSGEVTPAEEESPGGQPFHASLCHALGGM